MEALATDRPDISRGRIHHYQPQRFSHRVESARRWMFEQPARAGVIAGAACFVALLFTFSAWVHHCYEGHYFGPFLTSNWFGVPAAEAAAGVQPVVPTDPGWDGQFYYFQSNDILITTDARHH